MEEIGLKYKGLKSKDIIKSLPRFGKRGIIPYRSLDLVQKYIEDRRSNGYQTNLLAPQKGAQEEFLRNKASIKILHGNRGGGKENPYGTIVYTPNGPVKIEDLQIGDTIFDPNGEHQTIEEIFDHKNKDIYEFTFADGSKCESGLEHRWLVKITPDEISDNNGYRKYSDLNFTGKVITTKDIINLLKCKKQNIFIPLCNALEFNDKLTRSMHSYFFGVLLGNKYKLHEEINNGAKYFDFIDCEHQELFIPENYKYTPISERLQLIQGLIDTCGYMDDSGHIKYSTKSKKLAKDIQWVIRSLGGKCIITTEEPVCIDEKELTYISEIKIENQSSLFFLQGSNNNIVDCKYDKEPFERFNEIISYKYVGKKDARCLTVSGKNKLYVIDDFIVTHNTITLGLDILSSCNHPSYSALVFRKDKISAEKSDGVLKVVSRMLEPYGEYIDSKRLSRLDAGGEVRYDYFGDACIGGDKGVTEFKDRQQGGNVVEVAIDECAQATEPIINYLQTILRSSSGLRTHLIGACNPNPYSDFWRTLVSWWVDDDGIAIPERSGKVRYFFQYGDTIAETAWGDSPQEVFAQAKDYIIERFGKNKKINENNCRSYIKDITFIASGLEDNKILMKANPDYQKNLGGTAQEVSINAVGSWKIVKGGDEWITRDEMEELFLSPPRYEDYFECATLDIAYGLGDIAVMGHFIGHHLQDLEWSGTIKPRDLNSWVRSNLWKWGIGENRLAFDGLGAPTFRDAFPDSYPILRGVPKAPNKRKEDQPVKFYFDLRAQLADEMVTRIKGTNIGHCGFSINPDLLDKPYMNKTIRQAFMDQRRAIRRDIERENGKLRLLKKTEAKKIIGCSPDLIEGTFLYRTYFDVCNIMFNIPEDVMDELKYL